MLNSIPTTDTYASAIHDTISFYKESDNIRQAFLRAISLQEDYFLLPVGKCHSFDVALIDKLVRWSSRDYNNFSYQFSRTRQEIKAWLENDIINNKNRILFLIVDKFGDAVGSLGLSNLLNEDNIFEVDNVALGSPDIDKDLLGNAVQEMLAWACKTLPVSGFTLRVMADNEPAIAFYKSNNFVEGNFIPLAYSDREVEECFNKAATSGSTCKYILEMNYTSPKFNGDSLILTAGPSVSAKEAVYVCDAATTGWNSNWATYLNKFEDAFADYIGVKYAIATSSCTGALQIALMSLGIGPGDEVIVPDLTWVASANAIKYVGASPIFADIELDTWNLSSESLESLVSVKTKAIVVVHMYGHPARMDNILSIARKYNLKLVEDAAPAIGAEWCGKRCGSFGDFGAFSFQGAKLLVTGEGGMLVTDNEQLYSSAKKIWDQGRNPNKTFWIDGEGVKFKMSNLQAAFGLAQLERVDGLIEMKRRIFSWYEEFLHDCSHVLLNREVFGAKSIYWMTSIFLKDSSPLSRDELILNLRSKNVDTRPVFPAISQYPIWPLQQSPKRNSKLVGDRAINLPSGVCLSRSQVKYAAECIIDLLK